MSRYRNRPGIYVVFLLAFMMAMFAVHAEARSKNDSIYDGAMNFGAQLIHQDDGCLDLEGTVTSGNFFEDLKRIETGHQLEFRKNGRIVTEYPESLTTSIRIDGTQCAARSFHQPSSIFRGDSYALKFRVEWKEGMQLRPAILAPVVAHCTGYSGIAAPGQDSTLSSIVCQLKVDGKGVPLADHLIVSVFSADGKRLTRLSARP